MAGTRDKLIHDYFSVDIDLVFDICNNDIVSLKPQIEKIILPEE